MNVEIRDKRFADVVGAAVEFETLGSGFLFTEGPLWQPQERLQKLVAEVHRYARLISTASIDIKQGDSLILSDVRMPRRC